VIPFHSEMEHIRETVETGPEVTKSLVGRITAVRLSSDRRACVAAGGSLSFRQHSFRQKTNVCIQLEVVEPVAKSVKPRYRKAVVTFLDILGFREMIEESRKHATTIVQILQILKKLKEDTDAAKRIHIGRGRKIKRIYYGLNFSDSLIRITFVPPRQDIVQYVNSELLFLAGIQAEMTTEGILLRGGMSVGPIYLHSHAEPGTQDEFMFGPAFVKAYELERKAIFPRILVDQSVIRLTKNIRRPAIWTATYMGRTDEGLSLIDYLHGEFIGWNNHTDEHQKGDELLLRHKGATEKKLAELSVKGESVLNKAIWLALYHNWVIQRLTDDAPFLAQRISSLKISSKLIAEKQKQKLTMMRSIPQRWI
jgi:hypothetical protein